MKALAGALPAWSLEVLSITGNALGNEGAAALATFLERRPPRLRELNLELNGITDAGAAALARAMRATPVLDFPLRMIGGSSGLFAQAQLTRLAWTRA